MTRVFTFYLSVVLCGFCLTQGEQVATTQGNSAPGIESDTVSLVLARGESEEKRLEAVATTYGREKPPAKMSLASLELH